MDRDPGPLPSEGESASATPSRLRVFVGVTGSVASLQALRSAVAHARRLHAVLHVVRVWYPPRVAGLAAIVACTPTPWLRQTCESVAIAFEEALGGVPSDIDVRVRLVEGEAGVELCRVADRPDDLLVVGSGRGGALHRITHGAVAAYCVNHSSCPVLVVPPPPLARETRRRGLGELVPSYVPDSLVRSAFPDEAPRSVETGGPGGDRDVTGTVGPVQEGKSARRQRGLHWPPRL